MKAFGEYIGSFLIAIVVGLFPGVFILKWIQGFPTDSGWGDLGTLVYPLAAIPLFFVFHLVVFFVLTEPKFVRNRFGRSILVGAIGYAILVGLARILRFQ